MKYPKTKELLNQLVADLGQMQMVVRQTHWYMRGTGFLTLHPLLDSWMDDLNEQRDEIAERLIAIDGSPYATLEDVVKHTKIESTPSTWDRSITERFTVLSQDYRYLADLYQKGIEITDDEKDFSTQDMLIEHKTNIEKRLWMIQAQLGKAPERDN
ncbi:Dps family protein [Lactobacillus corticis]|uniref:DNA-binding ferritin-like protein n=1 Tax=Lactobacillus corticis TaxID=2201249 RepID=A0A916QI53_9LACO|nr:DNA starvation/stationary phase protection protein [Lactobacillus corticis]GFZ26708.1 DNA-binding ferritin-like protein [Lactobacillus corticis]